MSTYMKSLNISPVAYGICTTLPPEASRHLLEVPRPTFVLNKESLVRQRPEGVED